MGIFKVYEVTKRGSEDFHEFKREFLTREEADNFVDSFPMDRTLYFTED
jgi:hypothetical protein